MSDKPALPAPVAALMKLTDDYAHNTADEAVYNVLHGGEIMFGGSRTNREQLAAALATQAEAHAAELAERLNAHNVVTRLANERAEQIRELAAELSEASERLSAHDAIRAQLEAERDALALFALAMLEAWPLGDVDGATLQDAAVKHGLLVPSQRTEPCSEEGCNCAEYYSADEWAEGITCYRHAAWLTAARTGSKP